MKQREYKAAGQTALPLQRSMLRQAGIEVKQAMHGRLRLRIRARGWQVQQSSLLCQRVLALTGVRQAQERRASGSLIIWFEPGCISGRALLETVYSWVQELRQQQPTVPQGQVQTPAATGTDQEQACACDQARPGRRSGRPGSLTRVLLLSGTMLYAGWRLWILRLPLVQTPVSLIGLAAIWGTASLLKESKEALCATTDCTKMTVKPLLAAGSLLSIAMGQTFSAVQILWIYNVAKASEEYVNQRSRRAISALLEVAPASTFVMRDGMEVETAVADLVPGDVVAVHSGERMPVDGLVVDGEALLDEASINGRSEFVLKRSGDQVYAGTILAQGVLFVATEHTGTDTYLARIVHMVDKALANRAPVEQKADQLAARLMKMGFIATAATWLLTFDPLRTLTVLLMMSCPCATVLAASSAVTAALANAARRSIFIKGGLYLEQVGQANLFCFDKTGTLTQEVPEVVAVHLRVPSISRKKLLAMAATAESHNLHPMAQAILAAAKAEDAPLEPHAICEFMVGRGVLCTLPGDVVILVGNRRFMDEHGVDVTWFQKKTAFEHRNGHTVVYVAKNGSALGMLAIANPVRPEALATLQALRADGVQELSLITRDTQRVAESFMTHFPFDACRAELLPEDKAARVGELQQRGLVVMVGDGVNDALALARADVGIAMGAAGAEAAIEAADIALADSNLAGLMLVRNLSHQTMRIIEQNHFLAVSTDLAGTSLAMAGLLPPILAGLIHILHTCGILLNSGRLLRWEAPTEPMARKKSKTENRLYASKQPGQKGRLALDRDSWPGRRYMAVNKEMW